VFIKVVVVMKQFFTLLLAAIWRDVMTSFKYILFINYSCWMFMMLIAAWIMSLVPDVFLEVEVAAESLVTNAACERFPVVVCVHVER